MPTIKANISFDKLDKKCIQELPLIVDVISSTFNKIKILFEPFYNDMQDLIKTELKKKRKWHLSQVTRELIFYPFTTEEVTNLTKISLLENFFSLFGEFNIYSGNKEWSKRKASFSIYIGFEYDIDDEIQIPYSYFQIENDDPQKFGEVFNPNFYKKLCTLAKHTQSEIDFNHPSLDADDEETIWLSCIKFDAEQITFAYNTFKAKILIPFLRNLN